MGFKIFKSMKKAKIQFISIFLYAMGSVVGSKGHADGGRLGGGRGRGAH